MGAFDWALDVRRRAFVHRLGMRGASELAGGTQALCRTRTGDPFLTMEVLYQLS